ncbi:pyrroloquinoline quinone biosynthesis protein PqqF [Pseudomonas sp. ABC1]|uniref:pyrroloquinoline quinone biosynthesis protein PqqF n=1 Tax=Pseudomonas sp. ABC1 TaxID=2748080 RepID=UPI0015C3B9EB|nr:pyrroloquinoline quinone biosynthesis protein PqqF [Pseudomonas sp. ABC1]QLF92443.1 pyrroloquinoline quinone biosynthesis protein PqqF [Pseudomonas sp. ABC1]
MRVRFLHTPEVGQCAALVRVHAGAHDAPAQYPGLAHFLEHMVFQGSAGYCAEDGLMPYIQRHGGQLNASTRERHTDYFFQAPVERLEAGLDRLSDMLTAPLLDISAQRREREVVHAEFLARSTDAETLCDAALGTRVQAHPFAAFHAGNRDTLPVDDAAFQHALTIYHRDFYHAGAMELLLAGPFSQSVCERYAQSFSVCLRKGRVEPVQVPALRVEARCALRLQLERSQPFLGLAFYLDGLAQDASLALAFLTQRIVSRARHGLHDRLLHEGLCHGLRLRAPYWHAGQGVVVFDVALSEAGLACVARVEAILSSWLAFTARQPLSTEAWQDYCQVRSNALSSMTPLERLRHWVEQAPDADHSHAALAKALHELVASMSSQRPLQLLTDTRDAPWVRSTGFSLRLLEHMETPVHVDEWHWQVPMRNPWLRSETLANEVSIPPALRMVMAGGESRLGSLHIRWRFSDGSPSDISRQRLQAFLRAHAWKAEEAGVHWRLEDFGYTWVLTLRGIADAIVTVVAALAPGLHDPVTRGEGYSPTDDRMLLRRLLERLPMVVGKDACTLRQDFPALWVNAQWDALAVGLPQSLAGALAELPGIPATDVGAPPVMPVGERWFDADMRGDEVALLLFCPLPSQEPSVEAGWRLLARLVEPAFFRRLRTELQLGYAVFAGFRQCGEQCGIVFGVQSPTAGGEGILEHIRVFLDAFDESLAALPLASVQEQARLIARQLDDPDASAYERADLLWQACLAGHALDRSEVVVQALRTVDIDLLRTSLQALRLGSWRILVSQR